MATVRSPAMIASRRGHLTVARRFIAGVQDSMGGGELGSADERVGVSACRANRTTSLLFLDADERPLILP
jgi:hypothetical protein